MQRPLILIVDDRPRGLALLRDALERRYGADYRIVATTSPGAAMTELARAKREGDDVALVIADQWMPEITGREVLQRAHALHPGAQRALLVSWGDNRASESILQGCALGELDNYVLKPWSPAEVHLYPFIGEFLAEWSREHEPRLELVKLVGDPLSRRSSELRDMLERNGVPFGWYDANSDPGRTLIADHVLTQLPAVVVRDGTVFIDPSDAELADAFGVNQVESRECDLAVIGAGPSGLAAAVYAASEGLSTVVVDPGPVGGQAGASSLIRNFLGFPRGIAGAAFAQRAYQQAWLFGAKFALARRAVRLRASGTRRTIELDDGREVCARAVLIATGARYRRLGVPRVDRFEGVGLYYTAGSDVASALRGKDVIIIGGGNSAGQAVVHLAKTAHHVILAVRGARLAESMSAYLVAEIGRLQNVEVRFDTSIVDADGTRGLEQVTFEDRVSHLRHVVPTDALFVMIGALPYTDWLSGTLARDRQGYIITDENVPGSLRAALPLETSMAGVFATGDVRRGSIKRMASAVGEAAVAVRYIHQYMAAPVTLDEREAHTPAA